MVKRKSYAEVRKERGVTTRAPKTYKPKSNANPKVIVKKPNTKNQVNTGNQPQNIAQPKVYTGNQPQSIANKTNMPVQNNINSTNQSTISPATKQQSFAMTTGGQVLSGFKEGFMLNPNAQNRDLTTQTIPEQIGKVIGISSNIVSVGEIIKGISTSIKAVKTTTKVAKIGKVGTKGIVQTTLTGTPGFVVNTATKAKTAKMLGKMAKSIPNNPLGVAATIVASVGGIMATIGTYPFAGFIKEEALQTLGYGVTNALDNDDFEGAEIAMQQQEEILNPQLWDKIKASIPYVNVLDKLNDFYESARIKLAIDKTIIQDMKIKIENGETDAEMWKRIDQRKSDMERADIDYGIEQRAIAKEKERAAEIALEEAKQKIYEEGRENKRAEELEQLRKTAAFWAKERKKQAEEEAAARKATADFWEKYNEEQSKIRQDSAPSKLNFGLI